ncbi:MAG: ribonuclease HII [Bacilli bacterium]|nr:ribonuclease HII [Bacilli bacterium]MDD4076726.1 ribonuclease HII [Bacilli bacterium]MDD4388578.1 ribonuclease HII [Bacilli bacterium]
MDDLYAIEERLYRKGYYYIAGCDEAGRGPMAGPLFAAAVILPPGYRLAKLNDSKKVSPGIREKLYNIIIQDAIEIQTSIIDVEEVDRINVYQASKKAMSQCINAFETQVQYVLADAMPLDLDVECLSIIKGDQKAASIAAASIIAKVERDHYMIAMDCVYPQYGFAKHKGYVTKYHLEMLDKHGPSPLHRRSFAPVQKVLYNYSR